MARIDLVGTGDKSKFDVELELKKIPVIEDIKHIAVGMLKQFIEKEVREVCGARYERGSSYCRWGFNPGSICFEDAKVKIRVPRVVDRQTKTSYRLKSYEQLRNHISFEESIYLKILHGISTREYSNVISTISEQFGFSKSSVSRQFLKAAEKRLHEFNTRDLSQLDIVSIFLDGKRFSASGLILALGVDIHGTKHYLGFVESSSENSDVMNDFFATLESRGLNVSQEILFVIDGAKGLHKSITDYFGKKAFIQRCQWHKRRNVLSYLPKKHQETFRIKIQRGYERSTYKEARESLLRVHRELQLLNRSAANSLMEGFEETLTLHRLGVFDQLGRSFKTTNVLEAVNRQIQKFGCKITHWKSSKQIQARAASALIENEKNLSKVCGHDCIALLRDRMRSITANRVAA